MQSPKNSRYYVRTGDKEIWAYSLKCASTTLLSGLSSPRQYSQPRTGDNVRLIVRDPRDRLVSAWMWFTGPHNSYFPEFPEHVSRYLLDKHSPFDEWVKTAIQYWNDHWRPQTEIHPRWREFNLIPLRDLSKHLPGIGHEKKLRNDDTWEQYYNDDLLALVNEVYKEDVEMWKEATSGTDTGTKRIL